MRGKCEMKSYLRNYIINPHTTLETIEGLGYHADRGLGYVDYSKLITMYDDEDGKEYDGAEVYMCLDIDIERGNDAYIRIEYLDDDAPNHSFDIPVDEIVALVEAGGLLKKSTAKKEAA